ncbi:MAG TPA: MtrAB system histidine kinase MtrB [Micromonosporaceae bacterium]|jgi:two-component system sensor histidine kinase MtrB
MLARVQLTWRRSLQFRMVTITVATAGMVMLVFGVVVGSLITNGLVASQEATAKATVEKDSDQAVSLLESQVSGADDPFIVNNIRYVVNKLSAQDGVTLSILPEPVPGKDPVLIPSAPPVPDEFRAAVREFGFASQRLNLDVGNGTQLYLVFGRELQPGWGAVQAFYFFPLDDVVGRTGLVANTITVTGVALVLVVGLVVYIVTRLVVRPVRLAARTAQRLSNGLLDQRMEVAGEDDLAALAASFNQMAETLQRHILRLEEMSRLQRRFTSDVSHELRTPLTTVRMAADLIFNSRDSFDPAVSRSAELLQAELDRFENLLTELLEISRFDAGFAALDAEPTNLTPLLSRVVERLEPVADRAGVQIHLDLPGEPVVAEVDVRRVERILRNLIGNAIEYGDGKPVKVRLASREGAVAVTVRDYGVGLRPGEEKLVFNRFWRADPSRARQTGGTGLGLSISAEDARLHGGWLEAWGAAGQGAQFRLTLPLRAGKRLVSSPLRLVPTDFRPPRETAPEPAFGGTDERAAAGAAAPARRDAAPAARVPAVRPTSRPSSGVTEPASSEGGRA